MKIFPSKPEFLQLSESYNLIPLCLEMPSDLETPISIFYKLYDNEQCLFLLESMEGPEKWARYGFIGANPLLLFKAKGNRILIIEEDLKELTSSDPLLELKKIWQTFKVPQFPQLPRFFGGLVGYASYEMATFFERKVKRGKEVLGFQDLHFIIPEKLIVYDRLKHTHLLIRLVSLKNGEVKELYEKASEELWQLKNLLLTQRVNPPSFKKSLKLHPELDRENFEKKVRRAKEYIQAGDVVQVVLSQRFQTEDESLLNPHTPFYLYRALRKINPSPYMFFLKYDDEFLIGSSPEILVRAEGRRAETRPIAGTRKRGETEEEDHLLELELRNDEKELAEHIMLVDLGRNDLGRVCEYGSVQVYDLMVVERYSHVMHLVSGVKGILKDGEDMFSLFRACFPAGTVSGAPKVRAMEIIAELEEEERGPYAGAVGYFGFNGCMDFCITIRSFFQKGKRLYLQAGAGIVADSNPRKEYEETLNKAKALEKALELVAKGYFL